MEAKTHYSASDLDFSPLTGDDFDHLTGFSCGVKELDNFFHNEVKLCAKYKYLIPYKCTFAQSGDIVGLFTLANDILALEHEDKIDFPNLNPEYDDIFKRQTSYPAVNIGHLAVRKELQSKNIGKVISDFVRMTFTTINISGCQFITVDALNNQRAISFYHDKLGFEFQTIYDLGCHTRRMYLDIFTIPK